MRCLVLAVKRRIRWLLTFKQPLPAEHPDWTNTNETTQTMRGSAHISFEEGSEAVVYVRDSRISMPGFGELKVIKGEHFEFIDTYAN
jgi:hypothetical protein